MANVIKFPHPLPPIQPIAHFIRLGEQGYTKLANLHAAGRLSASRVVADASKIKFQKELVAAFRAQGAEIVLDTRVAELSAIEKFSGLARGAPWATAELGRPLLPDDFAANSRNDVISSIARFAVEYQADAVLAPTHYIGDPNYSGWFEIDRASCRALRIALDREGGRSIAIDYLLIASRTDFDDDTERRHIVHGLDDLPFENLWVRASGFGSDGTPLGTRRFITSMQHLHNLGKPVIADYLGGIVGEAALAFGAISGIAHGVGERERFDAGSWHKPPVKNEDGKGGRAIRVAISGISRSMTVNEVELLASAKGGRKLVVCCDRACCPHGLKNMVEDSRQHAAYQSMQAIEELAGVPDLNRPQHFLQGRMTQVERTARAVKELKMSAGDALEKKIDLEKFQKRLSKHSRDMENMHKTLDDLFESRIEGAPRARAVPQRKANLRSQPRTESK